MADKSQIHADDAFTVQPIRGGPWVAVNGNIKAGFAFYGAFVNHNEVLRWVHDVRLHGDDWIILPLSDPKDLLDMISDAAPQTVIEEKE